METLPYIRPVLVSTTMQQSNLPQPDLAPFHIKSKELLHSINEFKKHQLPMMRDLPTRLLRLLTDAEEYVSFFFSFFFFFLVSNLLIFFLTNYLFFLIVFYRHMWIHKLVEKV